MVAAGEGAPGLKQYLRGFGSLLLTGPKPSPPEYA